MWACMFFLLFQFEAMSIFQLATMETVYQPHALVQNTLYLVAFAIPFAPHWHDASSVYALIIGMGVNLFACVFAGYNGIAIASVLRDVPPTITIINDTLWRYYAIPALATSFIAAVYCFFEFCNCIFVLSFGTKNKTGYTVPDDNSSSDETSVVREPNKGMRRRSGTRVNLAINDPIEPQQVEPIPEHKVVDTIMWYYVHLYAIGIILGCLVIFTMSLIPLLYIGTPIWQQTDNPHILLAISICLGTYKPDTRLKRGAIVAWSLQATTISITHLLFEIERVNRDAQWLVLETYIAVIGNGTSHTFLGLYTLSGVDAHMFAEASFIMHSLHVALVGLGASLCVFTVFIQIILPLFNRDAHKLWV